MKHTCGHDIDISRTMVNRLSNNPAINQLLMETSLAGIPCYECLCEEYKTNCWYTSNDDGSEIVIAGALRIREGTHRQGAYAHLIRHVLCSSGLASVDQFSKSSEWIDYWNSMLHVAKPKKDLAELLAEKRAALSNEPEEDSK